MPQFGRVQILKSEYSVATKEEIYDLILRRERSSRGAYICVSNVHTTMMGYFDPQYRQITNQSMASVPDGMPLVWGMRLLGASNQDRVRGPTLMRDVCARGVPLKIKHYLYGGSPEALKRLQNYLLQTYPGIQIVGAESPPFRPITDQENLEALQRIEKSQAHIVWVGLGAPKQEIWISQQSQKTKALCVGVGAAFDLLHGGVAESPLWLQNIGMEWFFRLCQEPRRLWSRYLFTNVSFILLFSWQLLCVFLGRVTGGGTRVQ